MASRADRDTSRRPAPRPSGRALLGLDPSRAALVGRVAALVLAFIAALAFGYLRQVPAPSALAVGPEPPPPGDPRIALFNAAGHLESRLGTSSGRLSPAQADALVALGVPRHNIIRDPGIAGIAGSSHAEQAILRALPEGATTTRWGIAWASYDRATPCPDYCAPLVKGVIEGL